MVIPALRAQMPGALLWAHPIDQGTGDLLPGKHLLETLRLTGQEQARLRLALGL